jgi:hypothetical protein
MGFEEREVVRAVLQEHDISCGMTLLDFIFRQWADKCKECPLKRPKETLTIWDVSSAGATTTREPMTSKDS